MLARLSGPMGDNNLVHLEDGRVVDPAVFDIWVRDTSVPMSQDDFPDEIQNHNFSKPFVGLKPDPNVDAESIVEELEND